MGLLDRLFNRNKVPRVPDYSVLAADMHSHLIPGIDDGAGDMESALGLIQGLHGLGFRKLITTPHIMSDYYKNTPAIINEGLSKVRQALAEKQIDVVLEAAAEYYVDHEFDNKIERDELLTFGDNYLLMEVSFLNPVDNLNEVIFKLISKGYRPILAHVERYPYWYGNFDTYGELRDKGVLLQVNINSLTGHYSMPTKKIAEKLLDNDLVDFLGSDCHHPGHISLLGQALRNKYLQKSLAGGKLRNKTLL